MAARFDAMMANRHHHQAGIALRFEVKLSIKDREIDAFNRHRIEAHCGHAEQEITDVQIDLFGHPVVSVFKIFAVHIGKEGAAFVITRFRFRRRETAVGLLLIDHAFQPGIVQLGFCAENNHVRSIENFTFVEHVGAAGRFSYPRFAFIGAGNDKVPRLGVGARRAELQQRFQVFRLFCRQFFAGVKCFGGVAL